MTRPMSMAISLTRWLCLRRERVALVDGLGQRPIVWVNISRISTKRWYASRVEYSGTANRAVAHHCTA